MSSLGDIGEIRGREILAGCHGVRSRTPREKRRTVAPFPMLGAPFFGDDREMQRADGQRQIQHSLQQNG